MVGLDHVRGLWGVRSLGLREKGKKAMRKSHRAENSDDGASVVSSCLDAGCGHKHGTFFDVGLSPPRMSLRALTQFNGDETAICMFVYCLASVPH